MRTHEQVGRHLEEFELLRDAEPVDVAVLLLLGAVLLDELGGETESGESCVRVS